MKKKKQNRGDSDRDPSITPGGRDETSLIVQDETERSSSRRKRKRRPFAQLSSIVFKTVHYQKLFFFLLFLSIPFIIFGAQKSWQKTENRVEDWVPASFDETKKLVRFMNIFGGDEILMVSWDTCTIDDPSLEQFRQKLLAPVLVEKDVHKVLFRTVLTGTDLYDQLSRPPYELNDEEIMARLSGILLSKDGQKTGLIALISSDGMKYRQQAVHLVWDTADQIPGLGRDKIHVGGSTTDSVSIDEICRTYLVEMNVLTYIIGLVILHICFQNLWVALLVFSISFLNQQICLAMIYYLGVTFDSILMLSVNLMFVLSLSCSIHLVNYYRKAMEHLPSEVAVYAMLRNALLPVFGSIITTVVGLLSLLSSQLIPIRKFGTVSSIVLLISTAVIIFYISLAFIANPIHAWSQGKKRAVSKAPQSNNQEQFGRALNRFLFPLISRSPSFVLFASALLFGAGVVGVLRIETFVGIRKMLREQTRPIQDYLWLEGSFGPLIPVEVMIRSPLGDDNIMIDRMRSLDKICASLKGQFPDSTVISLLNFIPSLPDEKLSSFRAVAVRNVFRKKIFQDRHLLEESGYFQEKDNAQYWRITVRTWTTKDIDYGAFTNTVESIVRTQLAEGAEAQKSFQSDEVLITGGVPLVHRVQSQLIKDLQHSFLTAFLLIGLVLAFVFRSPFCGLLAVFPSVLPCIIVFGAIGYLGLKIELGTMLTGSAALGIAVDNTIHYVTWFRIGIASGMSRREGVSFGYQQCGMAMFQTTAVCAIGLLAYTMSLFIPTIYFSFFMSLLLVTALLGTYIILPAILLSPLGEFFIRNERKQVLSDLKDDSAT